MTLRRCHTLEFRIVRDPRGDLTAIEGGDDVPFAIRRVYYLSGVPPGGERGGHAHRGLEQVLVAVSGGFNVILDDGKERITRRLDRPHQGLYVAPMIWRELVQFSPGAVCLALASEPFDEQDYIRDYDDFQRQSW